MATRHCDGSDPNLVRQNPNGQWVPCNCGLVFNDEQFAVTYPHRGFTNPPWSIDRESHYRIQRDICQATWNYVMRSKDDDTEKLYTEMMRAVMALRRFEREVNDRLWATFPDTILRRQSGE